MRLLLPRRHLHACAPLSKNKQALKKLANSLAKGKVKKGKDPLRDSRSKSADYNETYKKLQELYESILYMSESDVAIQQNLDRGRGFRSFPGDHWLDRKATLRELPDKFDASRTPLSTISRYYKELSKLDKDKTVHMKYYKRYLRNYSDPIAILIQEFNGIDEKFRMLRRGEIDSLNLSPNAFFHKDNLFQLPYNVTGFDRSISGFPLRRGPQALHDTSFPKEFIQDLTASTGTTVRLKKKDLDFVEYNQNSFSFDPSNVRDFNSSKPAPREYEALIDEELILPKNLIVVDNIEGYHMVRFKVLEKLEEIITAEVNALKAALEQEISEKLSAGKRSRNLLLFTLGNFKNNQFKLCFISRNYRPGEPIVTFSTVDFSLIPYHNIFNNSIKSNRRLFKHLCKLFWINIGDQVDALKRIKYHDAPKQFTKEVHQQIASIVNLKLLKLFRSLKLHKKSARYQGVSFTPFEDRAFFRLYKGRARANSNVTNRVRKVYKTLRTLKSARNKRLYKLRRHTKDRSVSGRIKMHDLAAVSL